MLQKPGLDIVSPLTMVIDAVSTLGTLFQEFAIKNCTSLAQVRNSEHNKRFIHLETFASVFTF